MATTTITGFASEVGDATLMSWSRVVLAFVSRQRSAQHGIDACIDAIIARRLPTQQAAAAGTAATNRTRPMASAPAARVVHL